MKEIWIDAANQQARQNCDDQDHVGTIEEYKKNKGQGAKTGAVEPNDELQLHRWN